MLTAGGNVICDQCSKVKRLGIHTEPGQHSENAFADGSVTECKSAKILL
jgi:hypothetical protein